MAKTTAEKIQSVQEQIQQLENQRKKLMQEQKDQARKARTKRLIERGAILESLIPNADTFTNEEIKALLEKALRGNFAHKITDSMIPQGENMTAPKPWSVRPTSGVSSPNNLKSTAQGMG